MREQPAEKEKTYSELPSATTMTFAASILDYYGGESAPLTNEYMSNDEEKGHEAKLLAALRRVKPDGYGASWLYLCVGCRVHRRIMFLFCLLNTSWQHCRTYGRFLHARPTRACAEPWQARF